MRAVQGNMFAQPFDPDRKRSPRHAADCTAAGRSTGIGLARNRRTQIDQHHQRLTSSESVTGRRSIVISPAARQMPASLGPPRICPTYINRLWTSEVAARQTAVRVRPSAASRTRLRRLRRRGSGRTVQARRYPDGRTCRARTGAYVGFVATAPKFGGTTNPTVDSSRHIMVALGICGLGR